MRESARMGERALAPVKPAESAAAESPTAESPTAESLAAVRTVDVIILNWNGREHLEVCLDALWRQQECGVLHGLDWRVVVVDNGSRDDSVAWLQERWLEGARACTEAGAAPQGGPAGFGGVTLLAAEENRGFCGGNNWAVECSKADAVVLLNNDTAPELDWLARLVEALQQAPRDVAAVSGKLVDWNRRRVDFVEGILTFDGHAFQRGFRKPLLTWEGPATGSELLFACGGNMIIRRASFINAGGFDTSYFAYLEDVDLGWRLWSGGERVVLCNEAVARHRSMASSDQLGQDRRGFLFERNAFLTVFKNFDEEHFQKMMPAVLFTLLARTRTLLADNNPGGDMIRQDPYEGSVQDEGRAQGVANSAEADAGSIVAGPEQGAVTVMPNLWQKWRGWGTRELVRRGVRKVRRRLAARIAPGLEVPSQGTQPRAGRRPEGVFLEDPRTLAQFQAVNHLLENLDQAVVQRQRIQARRRRSDRDIFEKFPLVLVPTYPGDEELFSGPGFRALLPDSVPIVQWSLTDLMEMGE